MKKLLWALILIAGIATVLIMNRQDDKDYEEKITEKRSVFISYIELGKYLKNKDVLNSKKEIDTMVLNVKKMGFNEMIVQVRSFADSIYYSRIYPWSYVVSGEEGVDPGFDILDYFIERAHLENISIVAWINPYRIRNTSDLSGISSSSPAYKYLDSDAVYVKNGIYFNPSKKVVHDLVVEGVKEIVDRYQIDGILFDDYFYPDNEIDQKDYEVYLEEGGTLSKNEYNLEVVSRMVKDVYRVCHEANVKFGISPDGNIDNNYNKNFADVRKWCSESGYIDFIMPQIYYGFYNETRAFKKTAEEWESLVTNKNVDLMIALAFYKTGEVDNYAKSGKSEWLNNDDIIMREIVVSRNLKQYSGFALFRYDYIFSEELHNVMRISEIENMKKVLN